MALSSGDEWEIGCYQLSPSVECEEKPENSQGDSDGRMRLKACRNRVGILYL